MVCGRAGCPQKVDDYENTVIEDRTKKLYVGRSDGKD